MIDSINISKVIVLVPNTNVAESSIKMPNAITLGTMCTRTRILLIQTPVADFR